LPLWFSKTKFKEQALSTLEESTEAIAVIWNDVTSEEPQSVFCEWTQRVTWAIEYGGSITTMTIPVFLKSSNWKDQGGQDFLDRMHDKKVWDIECLSPLTYHGNCDLRHATA
jgi:hypothetical protein